MKYDFIGGLSIITVMVLMFGIGMLIGNNYTKREAANVGAGSFVVNPTNGNTSFVWNTNTPAR